MAKITKKMKNGDEISLPLIDQKKENVVPADFVFIDCSKVKDLDSFYICNHQVTQKEFEDVMGTNPSWFQLDNLKLGISESRKLKREGNTENHPVEKVSWYDAIYYCNKRSVLEGLEPVYSNGGTTDVEQWEYVPCTGQEIIRQIEKKSTANGYRLPTNWEWFVSAAGGQDFKYSGSNNIGEVAWYKTNSKGITHPVMKKKPNGYGLYDMAGNVWEWCWNVSLSYDNFRSEHGGSWFTESENCEIRIFNSSKVSSQDNRIGFRIVRSSQVTKKKNTKKDGDNEIDTRSENLKKQTEVLGEDFVFIDCNNEEKLKNFFICNHSVTQKEFEEVMGINPSWFQLSNLELGEKERDLLKRESSTETYPVEMVSWYDAIYYCNKKSMLEGLEPVYSVNGTTDVDQWGYVPCSGQKLKGRKCKKSKLNGYRLPSKEEWKYAARGGYNFKYSGSDRIDEVAWYSGNSNGITHQVMEKIPNGFGLYDMSGNVFEWCDDAGWDGNNHYYCGGGHCSYSNCELSKSSCNDSSVQIRELGFRLVCTAKK